MKRYLFLFSLTLLTSLSGYSQKEVYFNTAKLEDIQVESMHGIEIGSSISTLRLLQPNYYNDKSLTVPLSLGYFCEKRIAPSWTLLTSIRLSQSFMNAAHYTIAKDSSSYNDSVYYFTSQKISNYKFAYQLGISLGIEPRWYFGYKKRFQEGKAKLNSGWFLSVPVSVGATLIKTYKSDIEAYYSQNYKSYCQLWLSGIVGYRQAISKQIFLEGQLQLISTSIEFYRIYNEFKLFQSGIILFPNLNIKVAYKF